MIDKKQVRKEIFAKRAAHTDQQIARMSRRLTQKLIELPAFQNAQRIYAYADYNHEVCTGALIEAAWEQGKQVAVPRVVGRDMVFCQIDGFEQLKRGYMGIPEPTEQCPQVVWEDALMIMPGVAFDAEKNRCGYGGGFYDRFLEQHPLHTIAVAFAFQIVEKLPTEPTDIRPEVVVTEQGIYW